MKKYFLLLCGFALLGGCANWRPYDWGNEEILEPIVVFPSFSTNYLLSCLNDMQALESEEFDLKFDLAEAGLKDGRNLDQLRFICLSLNRKANYQQFQHGRDVFNQFLEDHPDAGEDLQGFRILVNRLDEEILKKWSAWKTLHTEKQDLAAEVTSLKVKIEEQQKQIEQLKNIEKIIKSREPDQP